MADVFISYRHILPDQDLAAHLAKCLKKHDIAHFVDTELRVGQEWVKVIDRELRACKSLVVLLSSDSLRSDMVRQEVKLAHEYKKQIFPVRVAYEGALPYDLGAYLDPIQYTLWRKDEPFDRVCGAILDAFRAGSVRRDLHPSPESLCRLNEATELRGAPSLLPTLALKPERSNLIRLSMFGALPTRRSITSSNNPVRPCSSKVPAK
jgi:hypothetical protein